MAKMVVKMLVIMMLMVVVMMMVVMMVMVMMVMVMMGSPGEVYGVDIDTGNSGALYADSFVLHEHYR